MFLENICDVDFVSWQTVVVRLLLAFIMGGIIGYNREKEGQAAGTRVYMIVSTASCLCMLISLFIDNGGGKIDLARLPAALVSGMGFLGAGTIWKTNDLEIKGLTTAAALWGCTFVGIAVGAGFYLGAFLGFLLLLISVILLDHVSDNIDKKEEKAILYVELASRARLKDVLTAVDSKGAKASDLKIERLTGDVEKAVAVTFLLDECGNADIRDVVDCIRSMDGVTYAIDI